MPAGRFAPSPSGPLHIGNLRTAVVAWLCARVDGSPFRLRIEDLDPVTSRAVHEAGQRADLTALGIDWDEPVVHQSARRAAHDAAIARLEAAGLAYPCFCSRREVREASAAPHVAPGTYPGTCRVLSGVETAARVAAGRPAALRLRASGEPVTILDAGHGQVTRRPDDIVLRRNDGVPAYHVAVVVDDAHQQVEEVVRGDDLLAATPSQAHLIDLLGLPRPSWRHVPLVVGADGERLAKRHGAVTMAELARAGVAVDDVRTALAISVGVATAGERVSMATMLARFDPAALPTRPWVFAGWNGMS